MRFPSSSFTAVALAVSSLLCGGCVFHIDSDGCTEYSSTWGGSGVALRGSGVAASETRDVDAFSTVEFNGSGFAHIVVANERSVVVTADDNMLEHLRTSVEGGRLILGFELGSYDTRTPVRFEIRTPSLRGVAVNGSGDLSIENLDAETFDVGIAGSGSITAGGRCDELEASIAGSGDLELRDLQARAASVRIAGSGGALVHVTESLAVDIAGSGDVRYSGSPRVTKSIAGSGTVARD